MTPPSNRSDLPCVLLGVLLSACAARGPRSLETVTAFGDEPRRAPGVAVDPAPELPAPEPAAHPEQGVVVLRTPQDPEAAREVVRAFFRAVAQGSYSEVEPFLADEAWLSAGTMSGRQRARQYWQTRLSRLDYGSLAGSSIFRETELETYRVRDLANLRPPRTLGVVAQPDDVIIRVPISIPKTGKTRLFGDEIVFVLRPKGNGYTIVDMAEDFNIP